MFEIPLLEEMGLPLALISKLVSGSLDETLGLQFYSGYNSSRVKQLLYKLRRQYCPGAFRISDWGRILVVIPRSKPTPKGLESVKMVEISAARREYSTPSGGFEAIMNIISESDQ